MEFLIGLTRIGFRSTLLIKLHSKQCGHYNKNQAWKYRKCRKQSKELHERTHWLMGTLPFCVVGYRKCLVLKDQEKD